MVEENRAVVLSEETLDDKHGKRRSQKLRLIMLRCFCFVTLSLIALYRMRSYNYQATIYQFVHNHHLQSYVLRAPSFVRDEYLDWLEQVRNNAPLIPRMLPTNEEPAFVVVDSYEAGRVFLQETKPPLFVLYYANWCPHSARAIPVVQEFAKTALRSRQIPLVAIEADNPLSDNIDGFPTVHLYLENNAGGGSDGNRAAPTEFSSKMSVTNLVAFLNRNVPVSNDRPNSQREKIEKIQRNGQVALSALRVPR